MANAMPDRRPWLRGVRLEGIAPKIVRDLLPMGDWQHGISRLQLDYCRQGLAIATPCVAAFRLGSELLGLSGSGVFVVADRLACEVPVFVRWREAGEIRNLLLETPIRGAAHSARKRDEAGTFVWRLEVAIGNSRIKWRAAAKSDHAEFWSVEFDGSKWISESLLPIAAIRALEPSLSLTPLEELARELGEGEGEP